eukprot:3106693-Pyramimonas_sp.AAC.1
MEEEDPFGLGGSVKGERAEAPAAAPAAPAVPTDPIRRGPSTGFFHDLRKGGPVEIDLCSPSPLKKVKLQQGSCDVAEQVRQEDAEAAQSPLGPGAYRGS